MGQDNGYTLDDLYAELNQDINFRKADRKIRPYFDLVEQLIHRRNELGLTQKNLAEILGTHQSRISKIESAELDIRLSTLIDIAEALETELLITLVPTEVSLVPTGVSKEYIELFQTRIEPQKNLSWVQSRDNK